MPRRYFAFGLIGLLGTLWACGAGDSPAAERERDLRLAPAESVSVLHDAPEPAPPAEPVVPPRPAERSVPEQAPAAPPDLVPEPPAPAPEPVERRLAAGRAIELVASDTLHSRMSVVGDPVTATSTVEILDEEGQVVIPAGAVFMGAVSAIEGAGSPGGVGTLVITFDRVHFGGASYGIAAISDSLGFEMKGQGISGGDAAKVGVGAVAGAIAGRVIGKDTKGAVIGGVVGAAAGGAVAAATKDQDLVLPAGALIRVVLTTSFSRIVES